MNNLEHLPEKFCFKLDEIGKKWIRETFGTDYYDGHKEGIFFNFPNFINRKVFLEGSHLFLEIEKGYTLIETSQLFTPQIPTIEKGVMMMVWDEDEEDMSEGEIIFYHPERGYFEIGIGFWKHAKPIQIIPEYTLEEAEKKFNIKIKK